jgi:pyruvate carboxylase
MKKITDIPINLHTHFTSGMGDLTIFKAIEAGVDIVDTCIGPYAYRSSHPAVEPIIISLLGTNRDTGFCIKKITAIADEMEVHIPKYKHLDNNPKYAIHDISVILHQTPGGMLSNLVNQLKAMDSLDKLEEVFHMLPKVRKDLGNVPLVTPTSQIVGVQTVNNVLFDKEEGEYANITEQVKDLCYGMYGKTTLPINPEVQKKALQNYSRGDTPTDARPGSILEPELEKAKGKASGLARDIDDELIMALYPVTGKRFLRWKYGHEKIPLELKPRTLGQVEKEEELIRKALAGELSSNGGKSRRELEVTVDGETFTVEINDPYGQEVANRTRRSHRAVAKEVEEGGTGKLIASIPGMIVEVNKSVGDKVEPDDIVIVFEAMKMMNSIKAGVSGTVKEVHFESGDSISKGDLIMLIEPE